MGREIESQPVFVRTVAIPVTRLALLAAVVDILTSPTDVVDKFRPRQALSDRNQTGCKELRSTPDVPIGSTI